MQPIRWINGKPVVYGEGNLLSNQTPSCCASGSQDGILAFMHMAASGNRVRVERVSYMPVWVRHPDYAVLPVSLAMRKGLAGMSELRASWTRTTRVIGRSKRVSPR